MSNVDTINRLAKDIAERFGSDINAASEKATSEFNQLYTNILVEVDRTFGNNRDYYEFCEVISDTFTKVMEKYDPQYDFWNFYVSSLKKKALSRIDKRNREKYEKTKSDDGEKSIQDVRKREYSLDEAISGDTESLTVNDSVEDTKDQTDKRKIEYIVCFMTPHTMYSILRLSITASGRRRLIQRKRRSITRRCFLPIRWLLKSSPRAMIR